MRRAAGTDDVKRCKRVTGNRHSQTWINNGLNTVIKGSALAARNFDETKLLYSPIEHVNLIFGPDNLQVFIGEQGRKIIGVKPRNLKFAFSPVLK